MLWTSNSEAVEWVHCVTVVNGALLLLAGWCEGFYGVRVNEALAADVVLMPFLLVQSGKCLHST